MNRLDKLGWFLISIQAVGFVIIVFGKEQRAWGLVFVPTVIWFGLCAVILVYTVVKDSDKLIKWWNE